MTGQPPSWDRDLAALPAIGLAGVEAVAALRRRFDAKYLVPVAALPEVVARFGAGTRVLEVDGQRTVEYRSVYFDTPDLRCYRDHLQRRRRRFKIRIRHYGGLAGTTMLEVKLKGIRGCTEKLRRPLPAGSPDVLDEAGLGFLHATLQEHYGVDLPADLRPVATTRFRRTTLVDIARGERATVDRDLRIDVAGQTFRFGHRHAILETKSPRPRGEMDRVLLSLRFRPGGLSKYCVGIAASRLELPSNPWIPTLKVLAPRLVAAGDASRSGCEPR